MPLSIPPLIAKPELDTLIAARNPVGWWKLNESAGTTAVDSSGNGRNGTYTGSNYTLQGRNGFFNSNAAGNGITIPDNAAFTIPTTGGFTVWWLTYRVSGSYFISKGNTGAYEWQMDPNAGMRSTYFTTAGVTLGQAAHNGPNTPANNTWKALGTSFWMRDQALRKIRTSCNGDWADPTVSNTGSGGGSDGTASVLIGGRMDDSPNALTHVGAFAYVCIFHQFFDPSDFAELYTAAKRQLALPGL